MAKITINPLEIIFLDFLVILTFYFSFDSQRIKGYTVLLNKKLRKAQGWMNSSFFPPSSTYVDYYRNC